MAKQFDQIKFRTLTKFTVRRLDHAVVNEQNVAMKRTELYSDKVGTELSEKAEEKQAISNNRRLANWSSKTTREEKKERGQAVLRRSTAKTDSSRFKSFKGDKRGFDPAAAEDGGGKSGAAFLGAGVHSSQPET